MCDVIKINIIHLSFSKMYEFDGWKFEYDENKCGGPWPLKADLEPRARAGDKFYDMFDRFLELSDEERGKLRIL